MPAIFFPSHVKNLTTRDNVFQCSFGQEIFHTTGVYITFDVEKFAFAAAAKRKLLRQSQKMQSAIFSSDTPVTQVFNNAVQRKIYTSLQTGSWKGRKKFSEHETEV